MKLSRLTATLALTTVLAACSKSPSEEFMAMCKGSKDECRCSADLLEKRLSKDDYAKLVDQLKGVMADGNTDKFQSMLFDGKLVNQEVSATFFKVAKACSK